MSSDQKTAKQTEKKAIAAEAAKRNEEKELAAAEKDRAVAEKEARRMALEITLLGGQAQAFDFQAHLSSLAGLVKLKQIKESLAYKDVGDGTWAGFLKTLGFGRRKIDEDIKNLEAFGGRFLESAHRLGLGYRDLAKLRALPEEARLQITDGKVVNLDKAKRGEVRELVEDLIVRNQVEKKNLTERAEGAEKKLKKAKEKEAAAEEKIKKLAADLEEAKTGLGADHAEAVRRLAGYKKMVTGLCNILRATDPSLRAPVRAEALRLPAYMEDLARLTALELG
ncbi:MAG: hypothetical protein JRC92_06490, partial [Deltaproteobacteria bacterium]|nr:hypothetical protein [Deltaproteobacteria bacterium]